MYAFLVNIMGLKFNHTIAPASVVFWLLGSILCGTDTAPLVPLYGTWAGDGIRVHSEALGTKDAINI